MGKVIGAAEFKKHCLRILDEVNATGEPVTVTKRGRAVAIVNPSDGARKPLVFGCMKDRIRILGDIVGPVSDPWDAEQGIWEPSV